MTIRSISIALMFILWTLLAGSRSWPVCLVGLLGAIVALRFFGAPLLSHQERWPLRGAVQRVGWLLVFLPLFLRDMLVASWRVAVYSFLPQMMLTSGVVRITSRLRGKASTTLLANLITLTPGTLTMDFDERGGCYYIHWINVLTEEDEQQVLEGIRRMEWYLERIFE